MKKVIILMIILMSCSESEPALSFDQIVEKFDQGAAPFKSDTLFNEIVGEGDPVAKDMIAQFHFQYEQCAPKANARVLQSTYTRNQPGALTIGNVRNPKDLEDRMLDMKVGGKKEYLMPRGPNLFKLVIEVVGVSVPVKPWELDNNTAKTAANGLKYIIVDEGNGQKVKSGETVNVHYSGYFMDYNKFDSSVDKGPPLEVIVDQTPVIKGWHEGLKLINHGGKARLIIPPELGYGANPSNGMPPNAWLIFDITVTD